MFDLQVNSDGYEQQAAPTSSPLYTDPNAPLPSMLPSRMLLKASVGSGNSTKDVPIIEISRPTMPSGVPAPPRLPLLLASPVSLPLPDTTQLP